MNLGILKPHTAGKGILIENSNSNCIVKKVLNESTGKNDYNFSGIYMQGDVENRNGRIYPFYDVLLPETQRYIREVVDKNKAGMELNHPDELILNPERTAARIKKLWPDGTNIMGESVIVNYGLGLLVKEMFEAGFSWGVSSRATGTVKKDKKVDNDLSLAEIDIVFDQSAPDAIVYHMTNESANTVIKEKLLTEQELDEFTKIFKKLSPKDRSKHINLYNTIIERMHGSR